jgi:hypothetical protein
MSYTLLMPLSNHAVLSHLTELFKYFSIKVIILKFHFELKIIKTKTQTQNNVAHTNRKRVAVGRGINKQCINTFKFTPINPFHNVYTLICFISISMGNS